MKNIIVIIFFSFMLLQACNTPYYSTVNNMQGQPAILTLTNGQQLNGKISIKTFDDYSSVNRIQFAEGASNAYKDYFINNIKNIYLNGSTYCVKTLIGSRFWGGDANRFVKQLTQPGGKMDLYQNEKLTRNNSTGKDELTTEYFIQLPGAANNEIYSVESNKFTPNFDDKMSAIVSDCASLAAKIKSKDKNYFYPFVVSNGDLRRKAVLLQIINDYNNCK
ncbi:hypothetical protein ACFOWM_07595 [Ferruginibacter yonginensis]|uniref:Lipoprotein n=1 Tax=Ferruginibacter yonginensis TaxID=1310416 RepID=A0ABV8QSW5_9BACT